MADQQARRRGTLGPTIAALATAPGTGAVAVVRLSGPEALDIARRLTGVEPRPRYAQLCRFRCESGEVIDRGLLLYFPAPHSYTGEDVVELHGHGGPVVSDWLLETVYALGARPAQPGEFTLRAFLNDKLDLAQAEAVGDLVTSGSRRAARAAVRSLSGRFSDSVAELQGELTRIRVQCEAWLDFPDEELDLAATAQIARRLDDLARAAEQLRAQAAQGAVLHDGLDVAIAGRPNAGKSSLLNRLAGYDAAIVTEVPGTTRDALREQLDLDGLPIRIVDTAGLRDAADAVEAEGVRRARQALGTADRVLWIADAREGPEAALADARRALVELPARADGAAAAAPAVSDTASVTVVVNKIDLLGREPCAFDHDGVPFVELSALTGRGLHLLTQHLKALAGWRGEVQGTFSARRRHLDALARAGSHVGAARAALDDALEISAEELRAAQAALGEVTGELTSDDLLGEIFSSFCIGK